MRKLFIPHKTNNYQPHFFRRASVGIMSLVILLTTMITFTGGFMLQRTDLLAEIRTAFLVDLANEDRTKADLHNLTLNPLLTQAATLKAKDMAENGYFDHTSPKGIKPWHWFDQVGYDYAYAGENLAIHFIDSEMVHTAWMNSPTHRANIMQNKFTEIGIATVEGVFNGNKTTFVVQMFGRPRATSVASRDVSLVRNVNAWVAENYVTRLLGQNEGSQKFEAGDRVRVDTLRLNVRRLPGGNRIDQVQAGSVGTVVSGPATAKGLTWWNIDFYDETNQLLTRTDQANVLGETVTTEDQEQLSTKGLSLLATRVETEDEAAPIVEAENPVTYTNTWERTLISPYQLGYRIYIVLATIVAIALGVLIGVRLKKQSYKHIFVGIALFTVLTTLLTISFFMNNNLAILIR